MLKTAREVEAKIKAGKPGKWAVGDGAYLQVAKVAKRSIASWLFRFDGKSMGLGPVGLVTLAEAREKAREARRLRLEGIDPLEAKRAKRRQASLDEARAVTFKDCAVRYFKSHAAGWRNPKHKAQWSATLETYAYPRFGEIAVADVDTGLVLKAHEPIWATKPETASRVRGRMEAVLDWSKARGYRECENPARWRGHLDKLLPECAVWLFEEFRVAVSKQTLSRELRAMGFRKLSARPCHHAQRTEDIEAFKKTPRPARGDCAKPRRCPVIPRRSDDKLSVVIAGLDPAIYSIEISIGWGSGMDARLVGRA